MKESKFVGENSEKWEELESIINQNQNNPEKLSDLFVQVTDDLSYARTFYKNRSIRVYLNTLTKKVFAKIYKKPKFRWAAIGEFFTEDVPRLMYTGRKEMFLSLGMFLLAVLIGIFSFRQDAGFAELVLGERYVEMTKANIEAGEPMAVYSQGSELEGFVGILLNNAKIDLIVFASGLLFSILSIFIIMRNGIMVGVFQYFFYAFGGFSTSLMTIWLHGTIEISTIILVGGAGLMAGKGLLFPGTYTRFQAFRISSTRGVKLLMAILPFTFLAALIESFITGMSMPNLFKILLIITSLIVMIFYFVVYPYLKFSKKDKIHKEEESYLPYRKERFVEFQKIKSIGEIVMDSIQIFRKYSTKILLISFAATVVFLLLVFNVFPSYAKFFVFESKVNFIQFPVNFFGLQPIDIKSYLYHADQNFLVMLASLSALVGLVYMFLFSKSKIFGEVDKKRLPWMILIFPVLILVFQVLPTYFILFNFCIGFLLLLGFSLVVGSFYGTKNQLGEKIREFKLISSGILKLLGLGIIYFLFGFLCLVIVASPATFFNYIFIEEFVQIAPKQLEVLSQILFLGANMLVLFAMIPLFVIGAFLWRNSALEQVHAFHLKKELKENFKLSK